MEYQVTTFYGINNKVSPFSHKDGQLLRCENMDSNIIGSKEKRPGYVKFLGTTNGTINSMWSWQKEDGSLFVYAAAGSQIHYSIEGTGAWSLAGNGTISNNAHVGFAVLTDKMIIGDGVGSTRHTTNGTSFTDTTLAPISSQFVQAGQRVYVMGTSSTMTYSVTGDLTNWNTTGTSDSNSIQIPGAGRNLVAWESDDRVVVNKNSGLEYKWDGFSLVQVPTRLGPISPYSVATIEDYWIYLNKQGFYGHPGDRPEILSNAIERQVYNNAGSGITSTNFGTAPATAYQYNYYCTVGTVTDDLTNEMVPDATMKYAYQLNEWSNYRTAHVPKTWMDYTQASGIENQGLIFSSGNQAYKFAGTATSDDGTAIQSLMEGFLHFGIPRKDKLFLEMEVFASPGCGAQMQIALANTFRRDALSWIDVGDLHDGYKLLKFPSNTRGKLMFYRITEKSSDKSFRIYGFTFLLDPIGR